MAPAFAIAASAGSCLSDRFASIGSALAWHLAWTVTRRATRLVRMAAVTLSTSGIFHSFACSGRPAGCSPSRGLALLRAEHEAKNGVERLGPWWLHVRRWRWLPWIHTRFVLIAAGFGALVLFGWRRLATPPAKRSRPCDPCHQRRVLDRILHRDLRDARSLRAVRERAGICGIHSGRPGGTVFRSAVRRLRVCSRADLRLRGSHRDGPQSPAAPAGSRAPVRAHPISARGNALAMWGEARARPDDSSCRAYAMAIPSQCAGPRSAAGLPEPQWRRPWP